MEMSVENVCGLLIRSKLLTPDGVKVMYQRWLGEAKGAATNAGQFSKWLVANQYLTAYQSALLARGQADHFFCNQYKILDRLGQGRMAGVYKAIHTLGQVVAIKVLPPSKAKDPQMFGRFQREARLAMRLKHPNVVRTFQVGESNGLNYLVMELLDGETLGDVLQRRSKLPPAEGVRLIYQALQGLQHIHEQGLVHRDLKPANLMLVPASARGPNDNTLRATLKILDIGLGRALFDENAASEEPEDFQLTGEGVLLGTPDYLAPEQARDAHASDIRADIYSLGCVLYHVLTGQPPFPDTNIISQMVRHAKETPRPLKELNPAVPDGLQQIMNGLLAKSPEQRYPTPERAAQALHAFLAAGMEQAHGVEADPKMKPYLNWLETDNGSGPASMTRKGVRAAPPGAASAPVATPAGAPPRAPKRKRSKKHKRKQPVPVAVSPGVMVRPGAAASVDVELIPIATATNNAVTGPASKRGLGLRDLLLVSLGAGVGVIVLFIYLWLKRSE